MSESPPATTLDLTSEDQKLLDQVEGSLRKGLELKDWWERADRDATYRETFHLSATHNRPDRSLGFFDEVEIDGEPMAVMGNVQEQFFDRPRNPGGTQKARERLVEWNRRQLEEFVLHYFCRISDFAAPTAFPDRNGDKPPEWLRPLSWYGESIDEHRGFGFELAYYKRPGKKPGKFAEEDKYRIVDLREIGTAYEWIVVKVSIFDFKLQVAPLGPDYPSGTVPLSESSYLVLSPELITRDEAPPGGEDVAVYGLGYAFLEEPEESLLAYGPGRFEAAFQLINFHVKPSGEIRARMAFVANRPKKMVNVSVDPVRWGLKLGERMPFGKESFLGPMRSAARSLPHLPGVDLLQAYIAFARMVSAGASERDLYISKKQLEKNFLVQHFTQHYNVVAGALVTWRQIEDWLDQEHLPDWVVSGVSS